MPVIIVTGTPCVGKTTVARLLAERSRALFPDSNAAIVNEESEDLHRRSAYATSADEKVARGVLLAALSRAVIPSSSRGAAYGSDFAAERPPPGTAVKTRGKARKASTNLAILDSLNYIKGYRYELHCLSKSLGQQHCVVWVRMGGVGTGGSPSEVGGDGDDEAAERHWRRIRTWNAGRGEDGWTDAQLEEIVMRYERPDERNRWDKPLYVVDMDGHVDREAGDEGGGGGGVAAPPAVRSVYNMHAVNATLPGAASEMPPTTASDADTTVSETSRPLPSEPAPHEKDAPTPAGLAPLPPLPSSLVEQIDDILKSFLSSAPLKKGRSTAVSVEAGADVLHDVDAVTQRVAASLLKSMRTYIPGSRLCIPQTKDAAVVLGRKMAPADVRRLRLSYVRWVAGHPPANATEAGVAASFLEYIGAQFR